MLVSHTVHTYVGHAGVSLRDILPIRGVSGSAFAQPDLLHMSYA